MQFLSKCRVSLSRWPFWYWPGTRYTLTLTTTMVVALLMAKLCRVPDPLWLLISCVVCAEVDSQQMKKLVSNRILANIVGAAVGTLCLFALGIGYVVMLLSIVFLTALCHWIPALRDSWRTTVTTGLIVLMASLQQASVPFAEHLAIRRAIEVIAGCLIAAVVSALWAKLWRKWDHSLSLPSQ